MSTFGDWGAKLMSVSMIVCCQFFFFFGGWNLCHLLYWGTKLMSTFLGGPR